MASRPKLHRKYITKNQQVYMKQVKRITRAIRELEKQGYRFTQEAKQQIQTQLSLPERVTQKAIQRLQNISRSTLRTKSTAISPTTGKVVTGTQAFKESMSLRSKKAAQTRLKRIAELDTSKSLPKKRKGKIATQAQKDVTEKGIATRQKRKDTIAQRTKPDIDTSNIPLVNDFIYDKLMERINDYDTPGANYLKRILQQEINTFGFDKVMGSINSMPQEVLTEIDYVIFYEENMTAGGASRSLRKFAQAIRGSILEGDDLSDFSLVVNDNYNAMQEY